MTDRLLDTDMVSLLFRGAIEPALEKKIWQMPADAKKVSVVTVAEMVQGALAAIRKEESQQTGTRGYELLRGLTFHFRRFQLVEFDDDAKAIFQQMSPATKRIGRADCEIAASAIRFGMVVVTRNVRDYSAIPGVVCEDWTK